VKGEGRILKIIHYEDRRRHRMLATVKEDQNQLKGRGEGDTLGREKNVFKGLMREHHTDKGSH